MVKMFSCRVNHKASFLIASYKTISLYHGLANKQEKINSNKLVLKSMRSYKVILVLTDDVMFVLMQVGDKLETSARMFKQSTKV